MGKYILAIDQSTQGTKALIFDREGRLCQRNDISHRQIIDDRGFIEHDPWEIWKNTLTVCRRAIEESNIKSSDILSIGISNQRETSLMWNKETGDPIYNAIVWQCSRAEEICKRHEAAGLGQQIREMTGLPLSPYFPAAKWQWLMEHIVEGRHLQELGKLAIGTIDTWLIYQLTGKESYKTDYSNASRTQLFNIRNLSWDAELCKIFGISIESLPRVCMSDSDFGMTNLDGLLPVKVPIRGVLGDSQGALFGQNCQGVGEIKATYGTGSSLMMNLGDQYFLSQSGLATSLAWGIGGKISYVLEGNLNYTGAVISWLRDRIGLIRIPEESENLARKANSLDKTYFVPAFSGLGAPYWEPKARGILTGISRTTGQEEIVRACLDSIAYQVTDLIRFMREETGRSIGELHVDGAPTGNSYLMQLQADIADTDVVVARVQESSGMGAAYLAGIASGLYQKERIFSNIASKIYCPRMAAGEREERYAGWQAAVGQCLGRQQILGKP